LFMCLSMDSSRDAAQIWGDNAPTQPLFRGSGRQRPIQQLHDLVIRQI
jgi:hypothetical protein